MDTIPNLGLIRSTGNKFILLEQTKHFKTLLMVMLGGVLFMLYTMVFGKSHRVVFQYGQMFIGSFFFYDI